MKNILLLWIVNSLRDADGIIFLSCAWPCVFVSGSDRLQGSFAKNTQNLRSAGHCACIYLFMRRLASQWCFVGILILMSPTRSFSYSLLTHEQIIDLTWDDAIVPLLLSRYPDATREQLE